MEKRGARLFQQGDGSGETNWNIVELDSRRQLRQKVNELRQQLLQSVAMFGNQLATRLVRSLQSDDQLKRQHIVWLLTLLDDKETFPLLQRMSQNERLSRPVRLSASLALAGMGATAESAAYYQRKHLYVIG